MAFEFAYQLGYGAEPLVRTFTAGGEVAKGLPVKIASKKIAVIDSGDEPIGVSLSAAAEDGDPITVLLSPDALYWVPIDTSDGQTKDDVDEDDISSVFDVDSSDKGLIDADTDTEGDVLIFDFKDDGETALVLLNLHALRIGKDSGGE